VLTDFGGEVMLPADCAAQPGQRVTLGLRPEHLRPHGTDGPGIACRVDAAEFTGADTLVMFAPLGGQDAVIDAARIQAVVHDRVSLKRGDAVALAIDPARVHVFDAASGQRL
jgi:multiple sugar transport system ATP-binding protein